MSRLPILFTINNKLTHRIPFNFFVRLSQVWKEAKIGTIDATSDNGMTETTSTANRSGTTSNTTSINSTAVKSSDSLSQNIDSGPSPSFSFSSKPLDWVQQGK